MSKTNIPVVYRRGSSQSKLQESDKRTLISESENYLIKGNNEYYYCCYGTELNEKESLCSFVFCVVFDGVARVLVLVFRNLFVHAKLN